MNEFLATLTQAVLLAVVPVCTAFLAQGIRALARYASTKTDSALAQKYLEDAANAITTAVSRTNQTYVDTLKKSGKVCVCRTIEELEHNFQPGDILVVEQTNNEMMNKLKDAAGIVTETGDRYSHAAIVGMALDIPVIVAARNAGNILKSGTFVTIDAEQGIVYSGK